MLVHGPSHHPKAKTKGWVYREMRGCRVFRGIRVGKRVERKSRKG